MVCLPAGGFSATPRWRVDPVKGVADHLASALHRAITHRDIIGHSNLGTLIDRNAGTHLAYSAT